MDCSTPDFPVHHQLLKLTQIHVHQVGDAIQSSHPLLSPSSPAFNLSQHQGLFKWVNSSHQVAKVLEFQFQHQSFQWPSSTNTQKRCPFYYRELEFKSRKLRDTLINRQICPWSRNWSRSKANRILSREGPGHSKYPLLTTQEKTLLMVITENRFIIFFAAKDWEALYSQQNYFSSVIPEVSTFILAITCLTTSNLPWFMGITFQVPMQYCSLHL